MGQGVAQVVAASGFDVCLYDVLGVAHPMGSLAVSLGFYRYDQLVPNRIARCKEVIATQPSVR